MSRRWERDKERMQKNKMPILLILQFSLRHRNPSIFPLPIFCRKGRGEERGKEFSFSAASSLFVIHKTQYSISRASLICRTFGDVFLLKVRAFWVYFVNEKKKRQRGIPGQGHPSLQDKTRIRILVIQMPLKSSSEKLRFLFMATSMPNELLCF